ncbi:nuclear transport factor 2 family protein [Aquimarina algicola]|uniref:Nuclear transport factor 2 family protein n=1 Tax=Aquimarina algicola TaxID=2589995 RepID=A0A504JEE0_9FLAO|nr:nuclear transport factor 2 family protein [Aquimarina algicola]TPN89207.1 nuclear transport factor 2 family protein [Aquimarina algicola]
MKKKHWTKFLIFLLITSISNNTIGQQLENESSEKIQRSWLESLKSSKNLESFYSENSGIMINDELFIGLEDINKQLLTLIKNVGQLNIYKSLEVYQLRENQKFVLGTYETLNGKTLSTIIGWKNKGKWTKEFEVIYINTDYSNLEVNLVNQARESWEKYSNQHRPDLIVDKVFSKNGKYFNRGTLYKGKEIIDAYSYMNNESYKIKLESSKVLQISNNIIYDIGTFEVGGKGLYTLIWKKEADTWKLLLDFNF